MQYLPALFIDSSLDEGSILSGPIISTLPFGVNYPSTQRLIAFKHLRHFRGKNRARGFELLKSTPFKASFSPSYRPQSLLSVVAIKDPVCEIALA